MNSDFCVFILTHGRPDNVKTYKSLNRSGYTGKVFLVVDDEDDTYEKYLANFPDQVIQFGKLEIAKKFDTGDNFDERRTIIYARNACFEIAEKLGFKYFIELDDDYDTFAYKFGTDNIYHQRNILNLDKVFEALLTYYKGINALTIAMAQNGDFIGGGEGELGKAITTKRKAMNTFICSTDRPFKFVGRINEDVNTYTNLGSRGFLLLTIGYVSISQTATQKNKGGMTDVYLDSGTFLKSFYSVMYSPSSVKISIMGAKHERIHHKISWNNTTPKIIDEKYKNDTK